MTMDEYMRRSKELEAHPAFDLLHKVKYSRLDKLPEDAPEVQATMRVEIAYRQSVIKELGPLVPLAAEPADLVPRPA